MNDLLELEPISLTANTRTEYLHGREYVVTDAVILREGILNGSDGPLFYSVPEITKNVGMWNGVPIVAPHPYVYVNGEQKHVSAQAPGVADAFGVGVCYNDRVEKDSSGKPVRKVDLYFDVDKANQIDGRIIPAVRAGEPVNVSTGITTLKRKAVDNNTHNGHVYTHTVHNIGADHLAVLMDEKGACSVFDGCGINVNAENALSAWTLDEINAVVTYNRNWSKSKREALSKAAPEDFAGPHQSFPIKTQEDVNSAAKLIGHADAPEAVKSKIKAIAKRKGLKVPDSWDKKGTKNEELELPSNKGTSETNNSWTDVARQASIIARQRTHATLHWHGKHGHGGKDSWAKSEHLQKLSEHANRAVGSNIQGNSRTSMSAHEQAANAHSAMAKKATAHGAHEAASLHSDAHAAHLHAASLHKKGVRNAMKVPKTCPDCGAPMNQKTGACTKCDYKVSTNNSGGSIVDKEELVSWLTTNCGCWKEEGSETVLNGLSEEQLKILKDNAVKASFTDTATGIVKKIGSQIGFKGNYNNMPAFVANSILNAKKNPMDNEEEVERNAQLQGLSSDSEIFSDGGTTLGDSHPGLEDFGPIGSKGTKGGGGVKGTQGSLTKGGGSVLPESGQIGVSNKEAVLNALKGLTDEEFMSVAPPGLRQTLNEGQKAVKEKKIAIINSLTAHITDPKQRKAEILHLYKTKTIPQLEEIAKYAGVSNRGTPTPPIDTDTQILANFFGQNGAPANTGKGRPIFNTENVLEPSPDLDLE